MIFTENALGFHVCSNRPSEVIVFIQSTTPSNEVVMTTTTRVGRPQTRIACTLGSVAHVVSRFDIWNTRRH